MKTLVLSLLIVSFVKSSLVLAATSDAKANMHLMQHGFILAADDKFASHLVANGHHSRQAEITGALIINSSDEATVYAERKKLNADAHAYFLFQAQNIYLPSLENGQVLNGHIVESAVGEYNPKNIIIRDAKFKIERVLLNTPNPFFVE